jgi:hypothetical protein
LATSLQAEKEGGWKLEKKRKDGKLTLTKTVFFFCLKLNRFCFVGRAFSWWSQIIFLRLQEKKLFLSVCIVCFCLFKVQLKIWNVSSRI